MLAFSRALAFFGVLVLGFTLGFLMPQSWRARFDCEQLVVEGQTVVVCSWEGGAKVRAWP